MLPAETMTTTLKFLFSHPRTRPVLLSLVSCAVVKHVLWYLWARRTFRSKISKRRSKAEQRKAAVEKQCTKEAVSSLDLVSKSVLELGNLLKDGSLTAMQVLHAFQQKALELTKRINCVTEPIEEAEEQARRLDASSEKKGLLFGIPVSVKENIQLAGYDATAGLSIHIDKNATEDAVLIQVLKKHGAVPFVRTNIPQTMLSYCCKNPLYGETINPHDNTRCPGGSSGGEGAIIGGGASIMGVGGDIGGSVRIPAEFCGVYGLKTTKGRISTKGVYTLSHGNLAIQGVPGPLARDFESLLLLSRALMSPEMIELDPAVPNLPFSMQEFGKTGPLRIGFYTFDGNCQCQPPVVRAVMEAKRALESMGHEVVPFNFHTILESGFPNGQFFIRLMTADRGEKLRRLIGHDDAELALQPVLKFGKFPTWLVRVSEFLLAQKDKFGSIVVGSGVGFTSIYEYFTHVSKFLDWQDSFMRAWTDLALDAVICPVFPSPTVTRDIIPLVTACGLYCQLYNSLNYPAGVIPVTKVSQEDLDQTFDPKVFAPKSYLEKLLLKSSKGSKGLSVGVQCVALPFKEEMCLRVMRDLDSALRKGHHSADH